MIDSDISCPACSTCWNGRFENLMGYKIFICSGCGLHFCDSHQLVDVDYDAIYKTIEYQEDQVDSIEKETNWHFFARIPTYKPFFTAIKHRQSAKLLDVGCGVGRFCRAASINGWDVTGIDVSNTAIEKGRLSATFPMVSCTAEEMLERGEVFDVVTAFEVLEHLMSPADLMNTIYGLLKPRGDFFCTVPNWESPTVQKSTRNDWVPPVHVLFFNENALHKLLVRAGFKNVKTGIIWVNTPPTLPGPKLLKYYFDRLTHKVGRPDPLGLWASGQK